MKIYLLALAAVITVGGYAQKQKAPDPVEKYASLITAANLKDKLTVLASADMQGRETASAGQRKAATYIEGLFSKFGLQPGTSGGYQMRFPIYQDTLIEATMKVNNFEQQLDTTFSMNVSSAANGTIEIKEVVFASYGIVTDTRNDYDELNIKDKWVMVLEGSPSEPGEPTDRRNPYSSESKLRKVKELGAKGIIIVSDDFPKSATAPRTGRMNLKKTNTASVSAIWVSNALGHSILNMDPTNLLQSLKIIPTGDYTANIQLTVNKRTLMLQSSNVLGFVPGTDKKDEFVIVTAHYDHLGVRGKDIYYGADDDGSGTTAVLQLAEAFAKAATEGFAPRRNIVFMTVSGEEKGLLGSQFYSEFPAFPLSKTSADLNIDMIGRVDPKFKGDSLNYVYIVGDDKLSSDLRPITDSINKRYINLQLDRRYNDIKDPNKFYYRSDHYNFAKNGVPAIFYFNGTHFDYHKPTDTVDKINFDLMARRTKLIYYSLWTIANQDRMLKRDIPLPKLDD